MRLFLDEIRKHATEIAPHLPYATEGDAEAFFNAVTPISVDQAVLERSDRVAVMPATFSWDDVGTWDAVGRTRVRDAAGNVAIGLADLVDTTNTIAWAEQGGIVAFGVDNLVIVRTERVTFVAHRDRTAELKQLLDQIAPALRDHINPDG